jgi:hypothetical protein
VEQASACGVWGEMAQTSQAEACSTKTLPAVFLRSFLKKKCFRPAYREKFEPAFSLEEEEGSAFIRERIFVSSQAS